MNRSTTYKLLLLGAMAVALGILLWWLSSNDSLADLQGVIEQHTRAAGAWGPVLLCVVFVATNPLGMPCSWLTILAGFLFGFEIGLAVVMLGTLGSGCISFLATRGGLRQWAQRKLAHSPRMQTIETLLKRRGVLLLVLIRSLPISHFTLLNMMLALTQLSFTRFVWTLVLGMLPVNVFYILTGIAADALLEGEGVDWLNITAIAIAALVALVLTIVIRRDLAAIRAERKKSFK